MGFCFDFYNSVGIVGFVRGIFRGCFFLRFRNILFGFFNNGYGRNVFCGLFFRFLRLGINLNFNYVVGNNFCFFFGGVFVDCFRSFFGFDIPFFLRGYIRSGFGFAVFRGVGVCVFGSFSPVFPVNIFCCFRSFGRVLILVGEFFRNFFFRFFGYGFGSNLGLDENNGFGLGENLLVKVLLVTFLKKFVGNTFQLVGNGARSLNCVVLTLLKQFFKPIEILCL